MKINRETYSSERVQTLWFDESGFYAKGSAIATNEIFLAHHYDKNSKNHMKDPVFAETAYQAAMIVEYKNDTETIIMPWDDVYDLWNDIRENSKGLPKSKSLYNLLREDFDFYASWEGLLRQALDDTFDMMEDNDITISDETIDEYKKILEEKLDQNTLDSFYNFWNAYEKSSQNAPIKFLFHGLAIDARNILPRYHERLTQEMRVNFHSENSAKPASDQTHQKPINLRIS